MRTLFRLALTGSFALASCLTPGLGGPALAQGAFNMGMLTNTNAIPASTRAREVSTSIVPAFRGPPMRSMVPGSVMQASNAAFPYQSTPGLQQRSFEEFIARVRSKNPAFADAARQAFAGHDYARVYQGIVAPFGLRMNDTADALTAYVVLGWMISTGEGNPSPRSVQIARSQIAAVLAHSGRIGPPDVRASLGEEYKILFVTLHAGWQSARREGNAERYADGVAAMFRNQSGLDLRAYRLGPAGFQHG